MVGGSEFPAGIELRLVEGASEAWGEVYVAVEVRVVGGHDDQAEGATEPFISGDEVSLLDGRHLSQPTQCLRELIGLVAVVAGDDLHHYLAIFTNCHETLSCHRTSN